MSNRNEALTDEFTAWLERYSPRRALQQNETALEAEVKALMRVIYKMAPNTDYLSWLERVTTQLDYQMKTSAWPTVAEIGAACSNINKAVALKTPRTSGGIDPVKINAQRMNDGENVGDGWLYGRANIDMMKTGLVSPDTLRRYRSALYFAAKDVYGEEKVKSMEAGWIARHEDAERLDAKMGEMPQGEPFKRMPVSDDDQWAEAI